MSVVKSRRCQNTKTWISTVEMKAFADLILKLGSAADIGVSNYEEAEQISP